MEDILLDELEAFADEYDLRFYVEDEVAVFTNIKNHEVVSKRLYEFDNDMFALMDTILEELEVEQ